MRTDSKTTERNSDAPSTSSKSTSKVHTSVAKPLPRLPPIHSQWTTTRISIFSVYHILFALVLFANIAALVALLVTHRSRTSILNASATAAATNLLAAILIRQDYIVNCMYHTFLLVPLRAPLWLRCRLALVYENGGMHSGCASSSILWFIVFTVFLTIDHVSGTTGVAVVVLDYILVTMLCGIAISALPGMRAAYHNTFERVHRFAGWSSLAVFWVELVLYVHENAASLSSGLIKLPAFWMLLIASTHSVYPWLLLRKVPVTTQKLSDHAIIVRHPLKLAPFRGLAVSKSPLREWHPFASFPNKDGSGGTLIISKAGDWTRDAIENPRTSYYVKGLPKTGVLTMSTIFRKIVVVTTGSGIGPCLGILVDLPAAVGCRVLWSTPTPEAIFGEGVVQMVRNIDGDAIIHDTRLLGRPDLLEMAYGLYLDSGAEAVFCISNKHLTRKIVHGLRAVGVPAFGPVWDS